MLVPSGLSMLWNRLLSIHVILKNVRYLDCSIARLVVFHYRHNSAFCSNASAVQCVCVFGAKAGFFTVPDFWSEGLVRCTIAARCDLPIFSMSRQPRLRVVLL